MISFLSAQRLLRFCAFFCAENPSRIRHRENENHENMAKNAIRRNPKQKKIIHTFHEKRARYQLSQPQLYAKKKERHAGQRDVSYEKGERDNMQIQLRDYQQECVDLINGKGKEGRHLIAMATGLGNTAVFSHIKRRGRMLILSHRDELVRQLEKYYEGSSFGIEKAEEHADREDVVSVSVQSLARDSRLAWYAPDAFYTVIIDEAHHAAAPSYKKSWAIFQGRSRLLV